MDPSSRSIRLKGNDDSYTTTLQLEQCCSAAEESDDDMCVLCHQSLTSSSSSTPRTCILDFLPEGSDYYPPPRPEFKTTGKLECGHRFCALGILYHMYALGMQCPICRAGNKSFCLGIECVPEHLQAAFKVVPLFLALLLYRLKSTQSLDVVALWFWSVIKTIMTDFGWHRNKWAGRGGTKRVEMTTAVALKVSPSFPSTSRSTAS
jgi:hypothetical protein